jgi:RNA polymerase sigma-70 factor (ECF subfamily)
LVVVCPRRRGYIYFFSSYAFARFGCLQVREDERLDVPMSEVDRTLELYERHHVRVFRFLRRAVQSDDAATDLTQEVFLRVLRGLARYQEQGAEVAWVFRIVRSVLVEHWAAHTLERPDRSLDAAPERAAAPTQLLRISLREALSGLSPENREMLWLRETVGLTYDEIGEVMGLTGGGVRARLATIRDRLAQTVAFDQRHRGTPQGLE